jgi:hypothetical protein
MAINALQRFKSATELRQHAAQSHSMLDCPHDGCSWSFLELGEWIEHWQTSHHDLLDARIDRTGRETEKASDE